MARFVKGKDLMVSREERKRQRREKNRNKKLHPPFVSLGRYSYMGTTDTIGVEHSLLGPSVQIGSFCSIANGVVFNCWAPHNYRRPSTFPFKITMLKTGIPAEEMLIQKGKIVIENDVWIADRATILGGITIESGAVIGANAVVAKNIPPYAIVVGNPCKIIKYRFTPEQIEKMLQIAWWNWPDEIIKERINDFYTENIDEFIQKYEKK